jgi:flagellar hook protein FlgE
MTSTSSVSLSGMQAAQTQLNASASNIANLQTPGYQRRLVEQTAQPGGGVATSVSQASQAGPALETDVVSQLQAKNEFLANLAVFKTSNKMTGALLDKTA